MDPTNHRLPPTVYNRKRKSKALAGGSSAPIRRSRRTTRDEDATSRPDNSQAPLTTVEAPPVTEVGGSNSQSAQGYRRSFAFGLYRAMATKHLYISFVVGGDDNHAR
ncbi:hypothetical protein ACP275_04G236200 [Erythranthe tilingii]